jgi:G patch domain/KOW motif-containing protein
MLKEEENEKSNTFFFKEEVKIADNMNFENYEDNPIENFGKNMLCKMGWKENTAIGRTNKGLVKPVEFIPRQKGLGLGATPLKTDTIFKRSDNSSNKKNYCGTKVKITHGLHNGLKGILIDYIDDIHLYINENDFINVQLDLNGIVVKVHSSQLKVYEIEHKEKKKKKGKKNKEEKSEKSIRNLKPLKWVIPNIKVRIISKKRLEGKYYNTKAFVNDIIDAYNFTVVTNDGQVHSDFKEKDLETIIPKLNEDVIILSGENKGEVGKLLSRDKKNDKVIVQLYTDMNIVNLSQDEITEICK